MWCIEKFSCFHLLTFVIFIWMIFDITKASPDNNTDTVVDTIVDNVAGFPVDTDADADTDTDTDTDAGDTSLSGQLFEFAQFFTTVNFN